MAKWATENPPKKRGRYLVTVTAGSYFGRQVRQADRLEYPKGNWYWSVLPENATTYKVVAWQKCPEPYNS